MGGISRERRGRDAASVYARQHGYVARSAPKLSALMQRFPSLRRRGLAAVLDVGCAPGAWMQVLWRHSHARFIVGVDAQRVDARVRAELELDDSDVDGTMTANRDVYAYATGSVRSGRGVALVQRHLGDDDRGDKDVLVGALRLASGGMRRRFNAVISDMCPRTTGIDDRSASVACAAVAARLATGDDAYGDDCATVGAAPAAGSQAAPESALLVPGGSLCVKVLDGGAISAPLEEYLRTHFARVARYTPAASRRGSAEQYIVADGFAPR